MSVHDEIRRLRKREAEAIPTDSRTTVRIRRDVLRTAIMQEEDLDISEWDQEEPTDVHHIPTMRELVTEKIKAIRPEYPQICKACRDQYVEHPDDFHCTDCKTKKIDEGWR